MNKSIGLIFLSFVLLSAVLSCYGSAATPVLPGSAPEPVIPASTPDPAATETAVPTPTAEPTAVPTQIALPQQWNGTYTYPTGGKQNISLLIETMDGTAFTGKMIWSPFGRSRGAILRMNGEFITDFGDDVEQTKWNNLEDYRDGERTGTWLKWTETEIIDGRNYTVNGWYYARIREDGTMVAVYFFNDTEIVADSGTFVLELVTP